MYMSYQGYLLWVTLSPFWDCLAAFPIDKSLFEHTLWATLSFWDCLSAFTMDNSLFEYTCILQY